MIKRLFIIGNGFDVSHDIKSKYIHFKNYLMDKYGIDEAPTPYISSSQGNHGEAIIDEAESAKILVYGMNTTSDHKEWSDFENDLAQMSFRNLVPDRDWYLDKEGDQDEPYYSGVFESHFGDFSDMVPLWRNFISDWIEEVNDELLDNINDYSVNNKVKDLLDENTIVLSFNYTETIERLYDFNNIIHIHNKVGEDLIWGHGEEKIDTNDMYEYGEEQYNAIVINMYKKDVDTQINKYIKFFNSLNDNEIEIYSFGFDYGYVDLSYIKEIINRISNNSKWYINMFGKYLEKIQLIKDLGFKGDIISWDGNKPKQSE